MRLAKPTIKQMFDKRDLNQFKTLLTSTSLNHQEDFEHTFEHMFNEINVAKGKMDPQLLGYLGALCDRYPTFLLAVINEPPSVNYRFKPCYLARAIQYNNFELARFLINKGASVKSKYASLSDQSGLRPNHQTIEEVISNDRRLRKELQPKPRQSQGFMCCSARPKL